MFKKLLSLFFPPLWCAGKLGNCPKDVKRFRFLTCLGCRWRRRFYGKYRNPPFWISYVYKSSISTSIVGFAVINGVKYRSADGGGLKRTTWFELRIDPRGHFTMFRCASIIVLDSVMMVLGHRKPFVEFCEFLAHYPTW